MKWDGMEAYTAIITISIVQTLLIFDLFLIIIRAFYEWSDIERYAKIGGTIGVCLLIVLGIFNFLKFKNKFEDYKRRWEEETVFQKRFRGVFVIIFIAIPFVLVAIIS